MKKKTRAKSLLKTPMPNRHKSGGSTVKASIDGMALPVSAQDKLFCERWLIHHNQVQASEEAGWSPKSVKHGIGSHKFQRYEKYLAFQLQRNAQAIAKKFVLKQQDILSEMMAIGYANPQDYIDMVPMKIKGKERLVERRKPIHELTRAQAAAISNVQFLPNGEVTYDLPDSAAKHPYLRDLGQHLGLFHQKLIQEHIHAHMHAAIDFGKVSPDKLEQLERQFLAVLGEEGYKMLGILDGEFDDVTDSSSHLIEDSSHAETLRRHQDEPTTTASELAVGKSKNGRRQNVRKDQAAG